MEDEPWKDLDAYMEKPYWVVDILPKQVPENSRGQYFKIADYYLCHPQVDAIYKKFSDIFLKLSCYDDMAVSQDGENWVVNPAPCDLVAMTVNTMHPNRMLYAALKSSGTHLFHRLQSNNRNPRTPWLFGLRRRSLPLETLIKHFPFP